MYMTNSSENNLISDDFKDIEYSDEYYDYDYDFGDETYEEFEIENETDITVPISENNTNNIKHPIELNSKGNNIYFTQAQIGTAANQTYTYIANNRIIPSYVNIGNTRVNMNDFLYLTCKYLNTNSNIVYANYNHVSSISGTNQPNRIFTKSEYLNLSQSIISCYETNGRNPKNINYKGVTISFEDALYFYSRIAAYKDNKGTLITNIRVLALYNKDYSIETPALTSNSNQPFTITTTTTNNNNGTYTLKLQASQTSNIYYTTNGSTPNKNSHKYTKPIIISNNTWVRYFAIKNNNEQTPILSYGINKASLPYITSKTIKTNQGYENQLNITTSEPATIYYSLNGTKPSIQSPQYHGTLTINNNTLLQYFAITHSNQKRSPTYYYRLQNPTPYITILNTTTVEDNHQNVTIIANKPGTIYYTRNGSTPTPQNKQYTPGTTLNLTIKTQLKAILLDHKNTQSSIVTYQAPQIITPSVAIINPITTLINNYQQIQFITNKDNTTIYYTTDGTNPKTSNTKKTILNNKKITIHKTTQLTYYTKDQNGYTSEIYHYRTPQHKYERPTITLYNTTGIYHDGTQKIILQSNQPGKFNITKYVANSSPVEQKNINTQLTITKNTRIQVYTQYGGKYSKIIEYNPLNGIKTVMNYNYTVKLPNISQYESIEFYINANKYIYTMDDDILRKYLHINLNNYQVTIKNEGYMNQPGVTIHKSNALEITFYSSMYGETNVVNVGLYSLNPKYETLFVYSNGSRLFDVIWKKKNTNKENITTLFQTLSNKFTKNETITYQPRNVWGCGNYDIMQTYVLTNIKITTNFYNQSLYNLRNYNVMDDLLRITPQDRTIITGLTTIWSYDGYADFVAYKYNSTVYRSDETLCVVGINYDHVNYVQFNDLKMGMVFQGNSTNNLFFNLHTSTNLPEIARISLNMIRENIGKSAQSLFTHLNSTSKTYVYINNHTELMKLYSTNLPNVYIIMNGSSGILTSIIELDGFEYNGAISDPLVAENETKNKKNIKASIFCFEDNYKKDTLDKSLSIMGFTTDSNMALLENLMGSAVVGLGVGMFIGGGVIASGLILPGFIIVGGGLLLADSHGILTGTASLEDIISFGVDLTLSCVGPVFAKGVTSGVSRALSKISKDESIVIGMHEAVHKYKLLNAIQTASRTCIDTAIGMIQSKELKDTMNSITGWELS